MADAVAGLRSEIEVVLGVEGVGEVPATLQLTPCRWCGQRGTFRFLDKNETTGERTERIENCPHCNGFKSVYRIALRVTSWHGVQGA